MRNILLTLCTLLFVLFTNAQTRTGSEALEIANRVFATGTSGNNQIKKAPSKQKSLSLALTKKVKTQNADSVTGYYLFNGENSYVIVSGDERAVPVLAYSDESSIDLENMPENMAYMLSVYASEISNLYSGNSTLVYTSTEESSGSSLSPLLGNIKWDQDDPYNLLCPLMPGTSTRTVTGCVATAMAQVMRYHKWPVSGSGAISYTSSSNKIAVTATLTGTNYDWTNMSETYDSNSTTAQESAVSTLMFHCGAIINMDYGLSSGASTNKMGQAFKNNFGYNQNIQQYSRNYFSRTEWIQKIKTELNAGRPVIYSGSSNEAGHAFVCDGYDSNDYFHINWGWSGQSNGYFKLSALTPESQGIGGSTGGYNYDQDITVGICKPDVSIASSYFITMNDTIIHTKKTYTRNETFSLTFNSVYNLGLNSFGGKIGVAMISSGGTTTMLKEYNVSSLQPYYGYNTLNTSGLTIPSSISNGEYSIYLVYQPTGSSTWTKILTPYGISNKLNITIGSSSVIMTTTAGAHNLSLTNLSTTGSLYQNKAGRINISITNNGTEYNSTIGVYLQSTTNSALNQLVSTENLNVVNGETVSFNFSDSIKLAPGTYYLAAMYDPTNNPTNAASLEQLGNVVTVQIYATPTASPVLTLTSQASFANNASVDKNSATITANINNTGGFYDKKLIAFIFETTGGSSLTYLGYQTGLIDQNETATVKFTGSIDLPLKNYMAVIYAQNTSGSWTKITPNSYGLVNFTLVDNSATALTEIAGNNDIICYQIPSQNVLCIKSGTELTTLQLIDLSGKVLISTMPNSNSCDISTTELKSGIYLLKSTTNNAVSTIKVSIAN